MRRVLIGLLLAVLALPASADADSSCGPPASGDMVALLSSAALAVDGGVVALDGTGRTAKDYALPNDVEGVPALSRSGPQPGTTIAAWRTKAGAVWAALLDGSGNAGAPVQVVAQGATGAVIAGASHVAWTADDGAHVAVVTAGDSRALTAGAQGVVGGAGAEVRGLTDDADGGAAWIGVTHGPDVDMYALQGATASGAPVALPRVADADAGLRLVGTGSVAYAAYVRGKLQVAALRGGRADVRSLGVRPLGSPWNPAGFAIDGGQGGYVIAWSAEGRGGRADIWLRDPSSPTAWRVTRTARFDEFVDDVDTALLERPLVAGTRSVQRSRGVITGNDRPISAAVWPATGTPTIVSKPPRGEESAVRVVRAGDNAFTAWDHFDLDDQDGNLRARRVRAPISRFPSPSLIAAHGSCSSDEG